MLVQLLNGGLPPGHKFVRRGGSRLAQGGSECVHVVVAHTLTTFFSVPLQAKSFTITTPSYNTLFAGATTCTKTCAVAFTISGASAGGYDSSFFPSLTYTMTPAFTALSVMCQTDAGNNIEYPITDWSCDSNKNAYTVRVSSWAVSCGLMTPAGSPITDQRVINNGGIAITSCSTGATGMTIAPASAQPSFPACAIGPNGIRTGVKGATMLFTSADINYNVTVVPNLPAIFQNPNFKTQYPSAWPASVVYTNPTTLHMDYIAVYTAYIYWSQLSVTHSPQLQSGYSLTSYNAFRVSSTGALYAGEPTTNALPTPAASIPAGGYLQVNYTSIETTYTFRVHRTLGPSLREVALTTAGYGCSPLTTTYNTGTSLATEPGTNVTYTGECERECESA